VEYHIDTPARLPTPEVAAGERMQEPPLTHHIQRRLIAGDATKHATGDAGARLGALIRTEHKATTRNDRLNLAQLSSASDTGQRRDFRRHRCSNSLSFVPGGTLGKQMHQVCSRHARGKQQLMRGGANGSHAPFTAYDLTPVQHLLHCQQWLVRQNNILTVYVTQGPAGINICHVNICTPTLANHSSPMLRSAFLRVPTDVEVSCHRHRQGQLPRLHGLRFGQCCGGNFGGVKPKACVDQEQVAGLTRDM
jgi:hypothetical protein